MLQHGPGNVVGNDGTTRWQTSKVGVVEFLDCVRQQLRPRRLADSFAEIVYDKEGSGVFVADSVLSAAFEELKERTTFELYWIVASC